MSLEIWNKIGLLVFWTFLSIVFSTHEVELFVSIDTLEILGNWNIEISFGFYLMQFSPFGIVTTL